MYNHPMWLHVIMLMALVAGIGVAGRRIGQTTDRARQDYLVVTLVGLAVAIAGVAYQMGVLS